VRRLVRALGRFREPAAWCCLLAGVATFVAVLANLIATGQAKSVTLIASADLFLTGYSELQDATPDESERS
jgi:hypothetical protein